MKSIKIFFILTFMISFLISCSDKDNPPPQNTKIVEEQPQTITEEKYYNIIEAEDLQQKQNITVKIDIDPNIVDYKKLTIKNGLTETKVSDTSQVVKINPEEATVAYNEKGEVVLINTFYIKDKPIELSIKTTTVSLLLMMPFINTVIDTSKPVDTLINELWSIQEVQDLGNYIANTIKQKGMMFDENDNEFLNKLKNVYIALNKKYSNQQISAQRIEIPENEAGWINYNVAAYVDVLDSEPPYYVIELVNKSKRYVSVYIDDDGDDTKVYGEPIYPPDKEKLAFEKINSGLIIPGAKQVDTVLFGEFGLVPPTEYTQRKMRINGEDFNLVNAQGDPPVIKIYGPGTKDISKVDNYKRWFVPSWLTLQLQLIEPIVFKLNPKIQPKCVIMFRNMMLDHIINTNIVNDVYQTLNKDSSITGWTKVSNIMAKYGYDYIAKNWLTLIADTYSNCLPSSVPAEEENKEENKNEKEKQKQEEFKVPKSVKKGVAYFIGARKAVQLSRFTEKLVKVGSKVFEVIDNINFIGQKAWVVAAISGAPNYYEIPINAVFTTFELQEPEGTENGIPYITSNVYSGEESYIKYKCEKNPAFCKKVEVDWGDGHKETIDLKDQPYTDILLSHKYEKEGDYKVTLIAENTEGVKKELVHIVKVRFSAKLVESNPQNGSENVDGTQIQKLVFRYDKEIDATSVNQESIWVEYRDINSEEQSYKKLAGTVSSNGNELYFTPNGNLTDNTIYKITVFPVKDINGNYTKKEIITFKTKDTKPPSVLLTLPKTGATLKVGEPISINIIFDEKIDPSSMDISNVKVLDGKRILTGNLVQENERGFIFRSDEVAQYGKTYKVIISGFKDLTGKEMIPYLITYATEKQKANITQYQLPKASYFFIGGRYKFLFEFKSGEVVSSNGETIYYSMPILPFEQTYLNIVNGYFSGDYIFKFGFNTDSQGPYFEKVYIYRWKDNMYVNNYCRYASFDLLRGPITLPFPSKVYTRTYYTLPDGTSGSKLNTSTITFPNGKFLVTDKANNKLIFGGADIGIKEYNFTGNLDRTSFYSIGSGLVGLSFDSYNKAIYIYNTLNEKRLTVQCTGLGKGTYYPNLFCSSQKFTEILNNISKMQGISKINVGVAINSIDYIIYDVTNNQIIMSVSKSMSYYVEFEDPQRNPIYGSVSDNIVVAYDGNTLYKVDAEYYQTLRRDFIEKLKEKGLKADNFKLTLITDQYMQGVSTYRDKYGYTRRIAYIYDLINRDVYKVASDDFVASLTSIVSNDDLQSILLKDVDGDGLNGWEEIIKGTSDNDTDFDDDGIIDTYDSINDRCYGVFPFDKTYPY
ncbi:Ig-like domain-containing protein [Persephonella sp.]